MTVARGHGEGSSAPAKCVVFKIRELDLKQIVIADSRNQLKRSASNDVIGLLTESLDKLMICWGFFSWIS